MTLNGSSVYTISEYPLSVSKTLLCNGATIQSTNGPIRASATGVTLIVDNCVIQGTGWALLGALNGSSLVLRNNTRLTGNRMNSAIYVGSSSLDMTGGSIDQALWGVNMVDSDARIDGVSISNTVFGVQNVASKVTMAHSQLSNLDAANPGTGLSIIASASYPARNPSAVIRDSNFTGFGNAVDIQPTQAQGLPGGTVEITGSTFDNQFYSALSANDAVNLRFANSRVTGAHTDGIFLVNSTGIIDQSEIVNSLNTGVTFWGCADGATIRNSLVSGSAHQGIAIVSDSGAHRISHNVKVLDNTIRSNAIANILVDGGSDAWLQGNIQTGAPDFSMRLHDGASASLTGELMLRSHAGIEMKDQSVLGSSLSIFAEHDTNGVLTYGGSNGNFSHCAFQSNGLSAGDYSIFVNSGAQVVMDHCQAGSPGEPALYNNAGNPVQAASNYWGDATGPRVQGAGGSNGALLGWNMANGSSVAYTPLLTAAPVDIRIHHSFSLGPGATTLWQPAINLSLSLTGKGDAIPVPAGSVAGLRVSDASSLRAPPAPASTFADGVVGVWIEYELLSRAQTGALRIRASGADATTRLSRLEPDRCWLPVSSTWDGSTAEVFFSPSNPMMLNGLFALGTVPATETVSARQLITNYYSDILGRTPEAGAVDAWYGGYFGRAISSSIDVRFVPREMARVFFSSSEYMQRSRTDNQFLRDAYQAFLQRAPAQWELDAWSAGTWNRPQVVALLAEADESGAYIQSLFPCLGGAPTRNFVTAMYIGLLDRLVDAGGLAYYEKLLDTAFRTAGSDQVRLQARDMGVALMASTEYQSKLPTNETNVVRLYRAYLGRFPSTDEVNYWRGLLDSHAQTSADLITIFAASAEFTRRVEAYFKR